MKIRSKHYCAFCLKPVFRTQDQRSYGVGFVHTDCLLEEGV